MATIRAAFLVCQAGTVDRMARSMSLEIAETGGVLHLTRIWYKIYGLSAPSRFTHILIISSDYLFVASGMPSELSE